MRTALRTYCTSRKCRAVMTGSFSSLPSRCWSGGRCWSGWCRASGLVLNNTGRGGWGGWGSWPYQPAHILRSGFRSRATFSEVFISCLSPRALEPQSLLPRRGKELFQHPAALPRSWNLDALSRVEDGVTSSVVTP